VFLGLCSAHLQKNKENSGQRDNSQNSKPFCLHVDSSQLNFVALAVAVFVVCFFS